MSFLDLAVSDLAIGIPKFFRFAAWCCFAAALAFGCVDLLFWLRLGIWDITRTGTALASFGPDGWATGWVGARRALQWLFHVPLALSLVMLGAALDALVTATSLVRPGWTRPSRSAPLRSRPVGPQSSNAGTNVASGRPMSLRPRNVPLVASNSIAPRSGVPSFHCVASAALRLSRATTLEPRFALGPLRVPSSRFQGGPKRPTAPTSKKPVKPRVRCCYCWALSSGALTWKHSLPHIPDLQVRGSLE